jgi:lysylphosphatidylglycerol synthetase-like protein (DUF2156 family)
MRSRVHWGFALLAMLGAALPLSAFAPFVVSNGLDMNLFFRQLTQTPVSRFFALDVLISAVTLWLFVFLDGRRLKMKNLWVYVLCSLLVGVSLGLPLFLFMRERKLNN